MIALKNRFKMTFIEEKQGFSPLKKVQKGPKSKIPKELAFLPHKHIKKRCLQGYPLTPVFYTSICEANTPFFGP